MISAFCSAVNPLAESRMMATAACATPHVNFTIFGGIKRSVGRLHSEHECG